MSHGAETGRADHPAAVPTIWARIAPRPKPEVRGNPLVAWGKAGAYYLTEERRWIRRSVETIRYIDDAARRQLTIDLRLPRDARAAVSSDGDQWEYCIPVMRLAKDRPVSWLDLRDETGEALPLLTEEESKAISASALMESVRRLLYPSEPSQLLIQLITGIGGRSGKPAASLFLTAARNEGQPPLASNKPLVQAVLDLSANRYVWLPLDGCPGRPRVIKISYRVALEARPSKAAMLGWTPFGVRIYAPQLIERGEYHLQVCPPAGLSVCDIELVADDRVSRQSEERFLVNATGRPTNERPDDNVDEPLLVTADGSPLEPDVQLDAGRGHLRVYRAQANVDEGIMVNVAVRPERRGVLTQALLASLLVAGMLWAYHRYSDKIEDAQTAAAVLLVVPALLALFSNAQLAEHPLTSRLLIALRGITVISALLCGLAAAALAGVRVVPDPVAGPLYASLATAAGLIIWIAYLASFPKLEQRARSLIASVRDRAQAAWQAWRMFQMPRPAALAVTAGMFIAETLVLLALALEWSIAGTGERATVVALAGLAVLLIALGRAAQRGLPPLVASATARYFTAAGPVAAVGAAAVAGLLPAPQLAWDVALSILAAGLLLGVGQCVLGRAERQR